MSAPVIVAAARSAIGTAGRSLAGIRADQLAGPVLAATLERSGLAPTDVVDVAGHPWHLAGTPSAVADLRRALEAG